MDDDFFLGDWVIRPQRRRIERGDKVVQIKPKSMAVLQCLASARGNVVSRNDLFDSVWPGALISDDSLTQCVVELRRAFGDSARNAKVIETIPKTGFRLIPPVVPIEADSESAATTVTNDNADREQRRTKMADRRSFPSRLLVFVCGALLLTFCLLWYYANSRGREPILTVEDPKAIAVLPFVDLSPTNDQEYFADGMSEELLNRLAQLKGLRVTGRTSSFYFKGKNANLRVIGDTLQVSYVLEGSVSRSDNQLRVTAQLVDVSSGLQLWSEKYDHGTAGVFTIQDEIAESVATALSVKLGVGKMAGMRGATRNIDAYNEVLLGQSFYRKFTPESVEAAIAHFKRATEIDPEYALAWGRLADAYVGAGVIAGLEGWPEKSQSALDRAVALAPDAPSVIQTVAFRYMHLQRYSDAEHAFRRGRSLDTGHDIDSIVTYAQTLSFMDRAQEVIGVLEDARRRDPLSGLIAFTLAHIYAQKGRFEDAFAELERAFALKDYLPAVIGVGIQVALSADDELMIFKWLERAQRHLPWARDFHSNMLRFLGDSATSLEYLLTTLEEEENWPDTFQLSGWAAYYHDNELALKVMERSGQAVSFWLPVASGVRKLPGFRILVREMGMVAYWQEFGWGEHCRPVGNEDFICE